MSQREVAKLRDEKRRLKQQLDNKSPVGAGARAVVAQSVRTQKARRDETARELERETTR